MLNGFLNDFPPAVRQTSSNIVEAAVEIYNRMSIDLLPTPAKSHYVFNLRDLSKCVQGRVLDLNPWFCISNGTQLPMTQLGTLHDASSQMAT